MKHIENFKKGKSIVKSAEQAKNVLDMLLQVSERENLEKGLSELMDKLKNPKIDLLMDKYPELLQEYELKQLLSNNVEIRDAEMNDIRTAGLFSCLQLLIHFCSELKGNPSPNDDFYDSLRFMLCSISSHKLVHDLLIIIVSVVGIEYYEKFQHKIQDLDLSLESARDLENDPELQEHVELMAWFALVRLFLESIYTCFNVPENNPNKTAL
ncbi:MAG: hypothetical protein ACOH1O_06975 [Flavobacterium sp.]